LVLDEANCDRERKDPCKSTLGRGRIQTIPIPLNVVAAGGFPFPADGGNYISFGSALRRNCPHAIAPAAVFQDTSEANPAKTFRRFVFELRFYAADMDIGGGIFGQKSAGGAEKSDGPVFRGQKSEN